MIVTPGDAMTRLFAACALAALLAGCATTADQLRGSMQPAAGQGYAVLAMTVKTYSPENASATLYWHGLDNNLAGTLRADFALDTIFGAEGSPSADGKLQLLALPPGRYQLDRAVARWHSDTGADDYAIKAPRIVSLPLNLPFSVPAGHSVYLGDIRFNLDYRPDITLLDSRQRDYAHMQRVWKVNDSANVQPQLLPGAR